MNDPPISVVVLTRNEEPNIVRCLKSLAAFGDVVVVDDRSEDMTVPLAQAEGVRVVSHPFESFARQRNWALEQVELAHDWVLFLDADEEVTPEFATELTAAVSRCPESLAAYRICRKTIFLGKWLRYSDGFPVWIMRVCRRGRAQFLDQGHGEVPVPPVLGEVGTIQSPILHHPFDKGLDDWFARHNRYSTREAELEFREFPEFRPIELFARDPAVRRRALRNLGRRLPGRVLLRFLYQYLWRRGFLDGYAGWTYSSLMASYEAMILAKRSELRYWERRAASNGLTISRGTMVDVKQQNDSPNASSGSAPSP